MVITTGIFVERPVRDINGTIMDITVKSLKFDADEKLLAYIDKKVNRLARFGGKESTAEVVLSLIKDPDNKNVKLKVITPTGEHLIERNSATFEDAVSASVDAMKEAIVRAKEKRLAQQQ